MGTNFTFLRPHNHQHVVSPSLTCLNSTTSYIFLSACCKLSVSYRLSVNGSEKMKCTEEGEKASLMAASMNTFPFVFFFGEEKEKEVGKMEGGGMNR